jgi:hypothetical protein
MPITSLRAESSGLSCSVACSNAPDCLIFGFVPEEGDDINTPGTCALTALSGTTLSTDLEFMWFSPV